MEHVLNKKSPRKPETAQRDQEALAAAANLTLCSCSGENLISLCSPRNSSSLYIPPRRRCNIFCQCKIWAEKCAGLGETSGLDWIREKRREGCVLRAAGCKGWKGTGRQQPLALSVSQKPSQATALSKGQLNCSFLLATSSARLHFTHKREYLLKSIKIP